MEAERVLDEDVWECIVHDIEAIVNVYHRMNKVMSLGLDNRIRREAVKILCEVVSRAAGNNPAVLVDVGAGPGDSVEVIASTCSTPLYIIAVDPSPQLLGNIRPSLLCDRVAAVAEYLPLRDSSINGVTAFYSARDFQELGKALEEMARVVKRGGIGVGDIFLPSSLLKSLAVKTWVCVFVPLLALLIARRQWRHYRSLCKSLEGWISLWQLCRLLEQASLSIKKRLGTLICREYILGGLGYAVAEL